MISKLLRKALLPEQRQSLAVNFAVSMAAVLLIALLGIVIFILVRGSGFFWPDGINTLQYIEPQSGIVKEGYAQSRSTLYRQDFKALRDNAYSNVEEQSWQLSSIESGQLRSKMVILNEQKILSVSQNPGVAELFLSNGVRAYINPTHMTVEGVDNIPISEFAEYKYRALELEQQIAIIRDDHLSPIHKQLAAYDRTRVVEDAPARERLRAAFDVQQRAITNLQATLDTFTMHVIDANGNRAIINLADVEHLYFPNQLSLLGKTGFSLQRLWDFLTEPPKQANTAGGVFPALFGTILMVFLMTLIVTPFGVLAAIYLSEYAPDNAFTTALRIGVSNMAGVPSIVYGVFGLGFFVYGIGGSIDALFYDQNLPSPTFGTPGLFWASMTMALLTLPVVVVATEEGLKRVPNGIRSSSYALGATKIETIWYTVLPIASPGIMTGVILAVARAAGEVAPLMLVGAVKFAPTLPVDGEFPFLHLERQFMHLGVFIFDGAFHSQTNSQGASMMFAACLLLLMCVFGLNLVAIRLRTRLRKRYAQE